MMIEIRTVDLNMPGYILDENGRNFRTVVTITSSK
jgi:hypothetical protein